MMEDNARIAPTDRSMPPDAITIAMPSARMPFSVSCVAMLEMFDPVRNDGDRLANTASSTASNTTRLPARSTGSRRNCRLSTAGTVIAISAHRPGLPEPVARHGQQDETAVHAGEPDAGYAEHDHAAGDHANQQ